MNQIEVELQEVFGNDRVIANSAWTSSTTREGKLNRKDEEVQRVVNMLADHSHGVPFESVIFRFWLKLPIAIDRQVEKHRISSQNGMSARYRTMPSEYLTYDSGVNDIIQKAIGLKDSIHYELLYNSICEEANQSYRTLNTELKQAKDKNIITNDEYKRVREFYRGILPQHNLTEKVITLNLRSLSNFLKLRDKPNAQPEIQYLAKLMLEAVEKSNKIPYAIEALKRNNWVI